MERVLVSFDVKSHKKYNGNFKKKQKKRFCPDLAPSLFKYSVSLMCCDVTVLLTLLLFCFCDISIN